MKLLDTCRKKFHCLDENVRDSLGIDLDNSIVILDEAHNIDDACRQSNSFSISVADLDASATELALYS